MITQFTKKLITLTFTLAIISAAALQARTVTITNSSHKKITRITIKKNGSTVKTLIGSSTNPIIASNSD